MGRARRGAAPNKKRNEREEALPRAPTHAMRKMILGGIGGGIPRARPFSAGTFNGASGTLLMDTRGVSIGPSLPAFLSGVFWVQRR